MAKNPNYKDAKYTYALQNIVFYAVHSLDCVISYYKDGPIDLPENAPPVLKFIASEFATLDYHDRYFVLRTWVAEQLRLDPACGLKFTEQKYTDLFADIEYAEEEANSLINRMNLNND